MKLPAGNRRIVVLMIVSQLLVMGFSLYWLDGQFRNERNQLRADLTGKYKASQQMVIDSLLIKHYISPVLGDSAIGMFSERKSRGYVVMTDSARIVSGSDTFNISSERGNTFVTMNLQEGGDTSAGEVRLRVHNQDEEMLLRSVKLIVQHVEDSGNVFNRYMHDSSVKLDTFLFVNDFESRVTDEGLHIQAVWITDKTAAVKGAAGQEMIIGGWDDSLPAVSITKYYPYLLGQILPQIAFSLILIILTGSAFLISFRSLKKQTILNEMRNSFISNISHELKTPVSTVKVAVEAMRNFDLLKEREKATEYMDMAAKEVKRLELLITRVLDNSIIEQGSAIIRTEEVDIAHLIRSTVRSMKSLIDQAGGEVIFDYQDEALITADPVYIQGVITNLIDNSLKYAVGRPEIVIELIANRRNISIIVSDNGPGIPEQYRNRIFDKFFRIPTDNIHNVKGYGLGLSFAHLIVKMHNGTITVKNNRGGGCSFTIIIPKERA